MATVNVQFLAETRGLKRGIDDVNGKLGKLGSGFKKLAVLAGATVVGGAALQFGKDIVTSASNAQQSIGATETVYGKYAKTVIDTSNKASKALGLSANDYRELANVMGASFTSAGVPLGKATKQSETLIKRGADMAATFGGTTKDAVDALGSAFRGEFDPIEKYGVSIKQSDINARLAAKGQDKLQGSALKAAQKQAAYDLIMQQTNKTQGQFGRESDTLAGQQQRVAAQWENLKAKLGTALLPVLTKVFAYISDTVLPTLERWWPSIQRAGQAFGDAIGKVKGFFAGLGGSGEASGKLQQVMATVQSVMASIKSIISSVVSIVTSLWAKFGADIMRYAQSYFTNTLTIIKGAFNVLAGIFKTIAAVLKGDWSGAWKGIQQIARGAGQVLVGTIKNFMALARLAITVAIKTAVAVFKAQARAMASAAQAAASAVLTALRNGFNRAREAAANAISTLLGKVRALPGQIKSALSGLAGALYAVGQNMIRGLINGIQSMAGQVAAKAKALADSAVNTIKGALKIQSPSRVMIGIGRFVSRGLAIGMQDKADAVKKSGLKLVDSIRDAFRGYQDKRGGLVEKLNKQTADYAKADAKRKAVLRKSIRETRADIKALDSSFAGLTDKSVNKLVAKVQKINGKLLTIAAKREDVAKRLAAAETKLAEVAKARADYAQAVSDSAKAYASITSITPGENETLTSRTLIQGLRDRLNAVKNYSAKLAALAKNGLNKATYDQLVQAGVEGGTATVEALTAGGKSAVAQVNSLQSQINTAAGTLGSTTSQAMYGAGVQAAAGLVNGLQSQANKLAVQAAKLAAKLVKAVKKALKIKSPSRVFKNEIGANVVDGFILGLDPKAIGKQGARMSTALTKSFDGTQLRGTVTPLSAPVGSGNTYNIVVNVDDSMTIEQQGFAYKKAIKAAEKVGA